MTCSEEWQIEIHSVYFFSNISVFYFVFSEKNTYVMLWQINNDTKQQEIQTVFVLFTQQQSCCLKAKWTWKNMVIKEKFFFGRYWNIKKDHCSMKLNCLASYYNHFFYIKHFLTDKTCQKV